MSKSNKKKPKRIGSAGVNKGPGPKSKESGTMSLLKMLVQPRILSTSAFGISGLLAGLATGLNHFPAHLQLPILPKMMALAAYLGDPHADLKMGLSTAFAGVLIGSCLGFSVLSEPKELGISLFLSVLLAVTAITLTGEPGLAGLGFLAGHIPAISSYLKLRKA